MLATSHRLTENLGRTRALLEAVGYDNDLRPFQWSQLMAYTLHYRPDVVLELGRGRGNSTCAFVEASALNGNASRVVSVCNSTDWDDHTAPRIKAIFGADWFERLEVHRADILSFDYASALRDAKRVLVFWDAHGFDIAEVVLGVILPLLASREHAIIMHDLSDARYGPPDSWTYKGRGLWRGNDWSGPRLRLGHIDTAVEQAIAAVDFTSRNGLTLQSADHSFQTEYSPGDIERMRRSMGEFFDVQAHWFIFSTNERPGPFSFPHSRYVPNVRPDMPSRKAPPAGAPAPIAAARPSPEARRDPGDPKVSFVVTSRNDDHGGGLLHRMQQFLDTLAQACARHQLKAELVIVEWNPPSDRPPLHEALDLARARRALPVRFVTVPAAIHNRFAHASSLPLFQMIAKNVGIRAAVGRFVACTNIDIILSDELVAFLANSELDPRRMYRVDRIDVPGIPPGGLAYEARLAWCASHAVRANRRTATVDLSTGRQHRIYPRAGALSWWKSEVMGRWRPEWQQGRRLHTNACGDFTMLHRDAWNAIRGYAEFSLYSFFIDAILCQCAHAAGYRELVLRPPMVAYHMDHALGSGWSVEGHQALFDRLDKNRIGYVRPSEYNHWAAAIRRDGWPIVLNEESWGLQNEGSIGVVDGDGQGAESNGEAGQPMHAGGRPSVPGPA